MTEADSGTEAASEGRREHLYKVALVLAALLIATATVYYRTVEDWSWVDAFYFSAIAVTTVGFGDITPTTDGAKIFTVAYIFIGISLVTLVLNERLRRHAISSAHRRGSGR